MQAKVQTSLLRPLADLNNAAATSYVMSGFANIPHPKVTSTSAPLMCNEGHVYQSNAVFEESREI